MFALKTNIYRFLILINVLNYHSWIVYETVYVNNYHKKRKRCFRTVKFMLLVSNKIVTIRWKHKSNVYDLSKFDYITSIMLINALSFRAPQQHAAYALASNIKH